MADSKQMRIAVTGGQGYIGGLVVDELTSKGHHVDVYDMGVFHKPYHSYMNPYANYTNVDLTTAQGFASFQAHMGEYDVVIHLAAIVGEAACLLNPEKTLRINYRLTRDIAEHLDMVKVPMVYASTCSVYGNQDGLLTEDSKTMPVDYYGQTKLLGEREVLKYPQNVAMRLGTVYGPAYRQRFDLVLNKFVAQATNKEKLSVFGGQQNRPFTEVSDIARAFVWAAENKLRGVYNVADKNFNLIDAAKQITTIIPSEIDVNGAIEDNRNYMVSSDKLKATQFQFQSSFEKATLLLSDNIIKKQLNYREPIYYNHTWVSR
jgi:nucleoside-diphosphate-sugar epimerase